MGGQSNTDHRATRAPHTSRPTTSRPRIANAPQDTRLPDSHTLPSSGEPVADRASHAATVARWFGLNNATTRPTSAVRDGPTHFSPSDLTTLRATIQRPGHITLITGPSGAGKSTLLRQLTPNPATPRWLDLATIPLPDLPLADCFGPAAPLPQVLADLSRVGLGEAWSYLRHPTQLSEGQRWRLRLALALRTAADHAPAKKPPTAQSADALNTDPSVSLTAPTPTLLTADEFAALLDRVTAAVVARALRRVVSATNHLSVVLATSHDDLLPALSPNTLIRCDFTRTTITHPFSALPTPALTPRATPR